MILDGYRHAECCEHCDHSIFLYNAEYALCRLYSCRVKARCVCDAYKSTTYENLDEPKEV